jgi:murein DD-endopeptidase MepM/ murein hydrolase activator NlpD
MHSRAAKSLAILLLSGACTIAILAQTIPGKPAVLTHVEPGLENAVKWTWRVAQSDDKGWGFDLPTPAPSPPPASAAAAMPGPEIRPSTYEVKHGDALILIGRRFGLTVEQLKASNGLKNDTIRVGQKLKIPTLAEVIAAAPPPKKRKAKKSRDPNGSPDAGAEFDPIRLQIFLDREEFSPGPISIEPSALYPRIVLLYESTHEDAKDDPSLIAKARAAVASVFTHYKLRQEDFRFIEPPVQTEPIVPTQTRAHLRPAKHPAPPKATHAVRPTYEELTSARTLVYRTPWEFVAERFHCQESYLHILNEKLPAQPGAGAEFQVPNVIPFEIEKAFDGTLQPPADPNNPVTASVVGLSELNIYQGGELIALFPLSPARPGLHGRGTWTVLDAIPRPRLVTSQEMRPELVKKPSPGSDAANPEPSPSPPAAGLSTEQYLAAGPRNPVGIIWINLAKSNSTEPLPYGLHGTSIPDQMNTEESIGGFRLTNWDIARAVHYLRSGTPLEWK